MVLYDLFRFVRVFVSRIFLYFCKNREWLKLFHNVVVRYIRARFLLRKKSRYFEFFDFQNLHTRYPVSSFRFLVRYLVVTSHRSCLQINFLRLQINICVSEIAIGNFSRARQATLTQRRIPIVRIGPAIFGVTLREVITIPDKKRFYRFEKTRNAVV